MNSTILEVSPCGGHCRKAILEFKIAVGRGNCWSFPSAMKLSIDGNALPTARTSGYSGNLFYQDCIFQFLSSGMQAKRRKKKILPMMSNHLLFHSFRNWNLQVQLHDYKLVNNYIIFRSVVREVDRYFRVTCLEYALHIDNIQGSLVWGLRNWTVPSLSSLSSGTRLASPRETGKLSIQLELIMTSRRSRPAIKFR